MTLEEEYRLKLEEKRESEKKKAVYDSQVATQSKLLVDSIMKLSNDEKRLISKVYGPFEIDGSRISDYEYMVEIASKFSEVRGKLEEYGRKLMNGGAVDELNNI